jgi:hypothetical protein
MKLEVDPAAVLDMFDIAAMVRVPEPEAEAKFQEEDTAEEAT